MSPQGRLALALALVAALVLVALLVLSGQRLAQAETDRAAAVGQAERIAEDQAQQTRREAEAADARAAQEQAEAAEELALEWAAAAGEAQGALAGAAEVLDASAGQVADDGVRLGLAQAMDTVEGLLVDGRSRPGDVTALDAAVQALATAATAVSEAQATWTAEQESARAAEAPQDPPPVGGPPSTGAGPDCGGPGSYEPPRTDGPTFYTSTPSTSGDGSNGRVPASALTPLSWCTDSQGNQQWLRHDAAAALTGLNEEFRAVFGENIAVDMSYRSYADQVAMREHYGSAAARPGTSNHGTGLAFDTWEWAAYGFGSARYEWLVANGPSHGWVAPDWARQGGSNPEYWHFEYVG